MHIKSVKGGKQNKRYLLAVYNLLFKQYGPRHWWPAKSDFEVMVGAILTQNTNWSNVEKAILCLRQARLLSPKGIKSTGKSKLARLIRCCGYYNIKTTRLKNFVDYLFRCYKGDIKMMQRRSLVELRSELLNVSGIGPETADSILLYALGKPIFVIDAYTKRIAACLGIISPGGRDPYQQVQDIFMKNLPVNTRLFNEFHALFVEHAKNVCKTRPLCADCILRAAKRKSF
jgi:endonuclease-3 related protein